MDCAKGIGLASTGCGFCNLSKEAQEVVKGMIDYGLKARIAMGMDEGFESFDPDIEYTWVKEIRIWLSDLQK